MVAIRRGFADLPHGQMHYRTAGEGGGDPILAIHASPGSSRQLQGLILDLATDTKVMAPDTPGNGDSPRLFDGEPTIQQLAEAELRFMDAMQLDRVKLYGSHTGAAIAAELALLAPDRVSHVVLDGVEFLTGEAQAEILANYAEPFTPDQNGSYLIRLFQFCRDQYLFFPWYKRTRDARRDNGIAPAGDLHAWVLEVMKGCETYHLNYRAAFKWDGRETLAALTVPTLVVAAENDPLFDKSKWMATHSKSQQFAAMPRYDAPDFAAQRKALIGGFYQS